MRRLRGAAAVAAAWSCAALATAPAASAEVRLQRVADGFSQPVHVAGAPGDGERLYVVEQGGVVKVVRGGATSVFVDLTDVVKASYEEGLLSIAFPPDFQTSRLFYVYYTDRQGDNRVAELRASTGDAAVPASRRTVLTIPHPGADNHNGGQLQFGRDGMLYLAPGDGARGANARDRRSLLGKILRLDPRGGVVGPYTVPADNPFAAEGGNAALVWAQGLRNPFRFSFDRATGDLVVGDVGQGTTEEIDWLPASGGAGRAADFGWDRCEGSFMAGSVAQPCDVGVLPILDKFQSDGWRSIVAGHVVRDPSLPSLYGRLVYGDHFKRALRSAVPQDALATDRELPGVTVSGLTSFGEDAGGCLYATTRDGLFRLVEDDLRIPCAPAAPPGGGLPEPPVGGGGGGGTVVPGPVARPLDLRVAQVRRQRVLRNGGVVVRARCAVACRLTATATLRLGRRRIALRRAGAIARGDERVRLLVRLTPRARSALRRAVRGGRRPAIALRVRARPLDGSGSALRRATVRAR
ncbi:PQQ-dependent sugar dehydrogenase [Conexibacter arvalis]|uniref:Glucose/Sorbosone dehydrogenase domain-containing protein n=1 Tax=Conexibacter arvalis TaxID=912552 RepID=A0A840IIR3_9ACTN|nr:PQQ-dependent sugar dehydrogenase [Conexibacter arvalis]MBB4663840.1 hypothetical protein [Conexibacter arvalis]